MQKTLILDDGREITIRRPTEDELLAYLDKRAICETGERVSNDANDDGDYELLALVVSPARAEAEELLEDFPLGNRLLRDQVLELAGGSKAFQSDPGVITDEHRAAGRRLLGFNFAGTPVVLTKLTRYEVKELEHRVMQAQRKSPLPSELAKLAREHVVALKGQEQAARDLLADNPLLAPNLGLRLYQAAQLRLQESQGK